MIWLGSDYLLFQMPSGESVPFSGEAIAVEFADEAGEEIDAELVRQAALAVYFYFKHELHRDTVTVGEFAGAMEKVLDGFEIAIVPNHSHQPTPRLVESDLNLLTADSAPGLELEFFPKLRELLRDQLRTNPDVVRFRGLRECVKQLTGSKRWSPRCRELEDQIIDFVRECLTAERRAGQCTLVLH